MPRVLGNDNVIFLRDRLSVCDIAFNYRMPTTEERTAYANACVIRKGKKTINKTPEARVRYGLKILTGIRDGDFETIVSGKKVPISSNPGSPHYDPEWKGCVRQYAGDLVELMAAQVFDMPATTVPAGSADETECQNCRLAAGFLRANLERFAEYLEAEHGMDAAEAEMVVTEMEPEDEDPDRD